MSKVKIYSTTWCHFCRSAKAWFKENKVEFTDVNVEEDEKAQKEMVEKSGQTGVPVIEVDGNIVVGFDKPKLRELLKIKG